MSGNLKDRPIEGTVVRMGGHDWVIPPLTIRQLYEFQGYLREIAEINAVGWINAAPASLFALIRVTESALKRNYPDILETDAFAVSDLVDLGNASKVILAVMADSASEARAPAAAPARASASAWDKDERFNPQPGDRLEYCWPPVAG